MTIQRHEFTKLEKRVFNMSGFNRRMTHIMNKLHDFDIKIRVIHNELRSQRKQIQKIKDSQSRWK